MVDASPEDATWLEDLRRRAYADLLDATWGGWDEARHSRHFSESLERGHISIIEAGGVRVGMIQVFVENDALEIGEIQIDPSHQGRGLGTSVLLDVMAKAGVQGRGVRLSVGLRNQKAIRLYERLGFSSEGQSDTHLHMTYEAPG